MHPVVEPKTPVISARDKRRTVVLPDVSVFMTTEHFQITWQDQIVQPQIDSSIFVPVCELWKTFRNGL